MFLNPLRSFKGNFGATEKDRFQFFTLKYTYAAGGDVTGSAWSVVSAHAHKQAAGSRRTTRPPPVSLSR